MNKNSEHIDEKLLFRFLLGEASQEETEQVENWLQLSEKKRKILDDYEAVWVEAGKLTPKPVAVDSASAWKKMSERIDKLEKEKTKNEPKVISLRSRILWLSTSAAAAFAIFFTIYQVFINTDGSIKNIQLASTEKILHNTLPDGSKISLNSNSKITYPKKFARNERRIKLEGEAYFDVEHNKEKPFVIEAGNAFIKVLGTSFNIKAYENSEPEVIVTEGLVQLFIIDAETKDTSAIFIKAGETGKVSSKDKKPVLIALEMPDAIFWMKKTLVFSDTDLKKVFSILEEYYNIEIKVSDKQIYNYKLSTTFSGSSIDDIIEVIAATFELKYTKEKKIFTIKKDDRIKKDI